LGFAFYINSAEDKGIEFGEIALNIDREIGNRSGQGRDCGLLAACYRLRGDLARAFELYEQQLAITIEIGHVRDQADALTGIANAYIQQNENQKAADSYPRGTPKSGHTGSPENRP
jgi:tetratricopeptide (TPR) repeat protein